MSSTAAGSSIRVEGLSKRFGSVSAVDGVSFNVPAGRFAVLLGPSGSGKTTILRMIAGLETSNSGQIWLGDTDATAIAAHRRGVGTVFQRPSMFPHYTVWENVAWGLKLRRISGKELEQRTTEMIDLVHLNGLENRYATQLSGGQAQRVAIARALAPNPPILLLDEPLSMLDAKLRDELKDVIAEVQHRTNKTTLMVTHDQREALSLADLIVVLDLGRIVQQGSPTEIYRQPATSFVADFVGNTNLIPAKVTGRLPDGRLRIELLGQETVAPPQDGLAPGDSVLVSLRPDDLEIVEEGDRAQYPHVFDGRLRQLVFTGDVLRLEVEVAGQVLRIHATGRTRFALMEDRPERVLFATGELVIIPTGASSGEVRNP